MKKILLAILCWGAFLLAESVSSGFPLLEIPVTARQTALAGSMTAYPPTSYSSIANPAALILAEQNEAEFLQANSSDLATYYYNGLILSDMQIPIGISYINLRVDDLQETAASLDMSGEVQILGDLSYQAEVLALATAFSIIDPLSVGINYKYLSAELSVDSQQAKGYSLGLGLLYALADLKVGLMVDNLTSEIWYQHSSELLPQIYRLALLKHCQNFTAIIELERSAGKDLFGRGAVVIGLTKHFELLAGLAQQRFSAGACYHFNNIIVDYAYLSQSSDHFGSENRVSLRINW